MTKANSFYASIFKKIMRAVRLKPYQRNIQAELITMLYQQGNTALLGVIATATGIAYIFYDEAPFLLVSSWLAIVYLLSFIRFLFIKKFKSKTRNRNNIILWGWLFSFFVFLSGLSWSAASIIFFTPDNLILFAILTLIILAMSVGSLAALSAFPIAYYLFIIPAILPIIWLYLHIEAPNYNVFGFLLFIFSFALFSIVQINHKILKNSIILRFEKNSLVRQLTQQKEKAERANLSKTRFLAAASHDIRQPIYAIGLFSGILENKIEHNGQKEIVHKIQKSSHSLNELLDSLLDISKLDAGIIKINPEVFDINHLYESLNNEFQPQAEEKNLKLRFVRTKKNVYSDPSIVERIAMNLISNAIRYTDKGGIVVGCRPYKDQLLFAVYDSGIGISADNIDIIFDEFFQLHNPERAQSKGIGLGLSIVKQMTELLDAKLWVRSTAGKGSVFGILLPLSSNTANKAPPHIEDTYPSSFEHKCILIIDDNHDICDGLTQLLQSWHCEVISANSGDNAVKALKNTSAPPDLMLIDYRLKSHETGLDAVNKLHAAYPNTITTPIVIITGDTSPQRIREVEQSQYQVIHKPVSPQALKKLFTEIFNKH